MGKKDNKLNPYDLINGKFRILLRGGQLFAGEIKGAWDDAILLNDVANGNCIIALDYIAVLMEGIEPHAVEQPAEEVEQKEEA